MKELPGFIRLRVCLYFVFIALAGYFLFHPPGITAVFVAVSAFFGCAYAYSYNNITDTMEDSINRGKTSAFVSSKAGKRLMIYFLLPAIFFSLIVSLTSLVFALAGIAMGFIYSRFRLKKYFLAKNVYTAFSVNQAFLVGASAGGFLPVETLPYYFMMCILVFVLSVTSDLRDYKGDKMAGVKTLPVRLGYARGRVLVILMMTAFCAINAFSGKFIIMLPFMSLAAVAVVVNRPGFAHVLGGNSFFFLAFWLML